MTSPPAPIPSPKRIQTPFRWLPPGGPVAPDKSVVAVTRGCLGWPITAGHVRSRQHVTA